jgi:hypothetical protein
MKFNNKGVEAAKNPYIASFVAPPKPKQTYKRIDSHEFVKVWVTSDSLNDVCERLELSKQQASSKANNLRKRGVKLPKLSRRPDKNSVHELNKLVERYAK